MPTPLELIARYRARLDKQSDADLKRLISVYGSMSERIKDKVDLLMLEIERTPDMNVKSSARYKELTATLEREYERYDVYLETELEQIASKSKAQAKTDIGVLIATALVAAGLNVKPKQIPQATTPVNVLAPGSEHAKRLAKLAPLQAQRIIDKITEGIRLGYGYQKLGRQIVDDLGLGLSDALRWARTVQMEAYRETSHNTMLENSAYVDGWTWFAQVDDRTCEDCSGSHGSEHTADESLNDLTTHIWNCRCVELPHVTGDDNPITGNGWGEEPEAEDGKDNGIEDKLNELNDIAETRELTPAEEELGNVLSLEGDGTHETYYVRKDDGEITAGIAWHLRDESMYIDHLGSLIAGSGREAVYVVIQEALEKELGISGQSTPDAERFWSRLGFTLDDNGKFNATFRELLRLFSD